MLLLHLYTLEYQLNGAPELLIFSLFFNLLFRIIKMFLWAPPFRLHRFSCTSHLRKLAFYLTCRSFPGFLYIANSSFICFVIPSFNLPFYSNFPLLFRYSRVCMSFSLQLLFIWYFNWNINSIEILIYLSSKHKYMPVISSYCKTQKSQRHSLISS